MVFKGETKQNLLTHQKSSQCHLTEARLWGLILASFQLQQHLIKEKENGEKLIDQEIEQILRKFEKVFEEPQGLPPNRKHEHRILIKEGVSLVNVCHTGMLICTKMKWRGW